MSKHSYFWIILCVFAQTGCMPWYNIKPKLEEQGVDNVYEISNTNNKPIYIYFEPSIPELIKSFDFPKPKKEVRLLYKLRIDPKSKSIVCSEMKRTTDNILFDVRDIELESYFFSNIAIKIKGNHLFNSYIRNIRNERNMAYASAYIQIKEDSVWVDYILVKPE